MGEGWGGKGRGRRRNIFYVIIPVLIPEGTLLESPYATFWMKEPPIAEGRLAW
jgi:hypothetical protein